MRQVTISIPKIAAITVSAVALAAGGILLSDAVGIMSDTIGHHHLSTLWEQSGNLFSAACILILLGYSTALIAVLHSSQKTARLRKEAAALDRKNQAAEALNRQTQQLEHHQRLHILGVLTSSIAHEFNNLLTPIMGYSMMALEKIPPEDEELYDEILEIYNASRKAKTIISRLSDLSRKNSSNTFREVSPDDLVRKILDIAAPAKPPKTEIRVSLNCWEQRMEANEIQLGQLLLNLVLNSFDAIGQQQGLLEISTSFDEHNICLRVKDSGCGIPEELLPKIFEPFFTTKEAGKGTGLGLAIVAQVVEDHHGQITADSHPGEGTTFTVSIPRTRDSVDIP